jgi:beta-lactamase class A
MPADQKKFGLGKTTAREMATLMTKIVTCDVAEPGAPGRTSDADLCAVGERFWEWPISVLIPKE